MEKGFPKVKALLLIFLKVPLHHRNDLLDQIAKPFGKFFFRSL
jgi:hypothetical protein